MEPLWYNVENWVREVLRKSSVSMIKIRKKELEMDKIENLMKKLEDIIDRKNSEYRFFLIDGQIGAGKRLWDVFKSMSFKSKFCTVVLLLGIVFFSYYTVKNTVIIFKNYLLN